MDWLASVDEDRIHLSVVTLAELRHGIEPLSPGTRRGRLEQWLSSDLAQRFAARILPVDAVIADRWGRVLAQAEASGRAAGGMDALVAATAGYFYLTLVTRNVSQSNAHETHINPPTPTNFTHSKMKGPPPPDVNFNCTDKTLARVVTLMAMDAAKIELQERGDYMEAHEITYVVGFTLEPLEFNDDWDIAENETEI